MSSGAIEKPLHPAEEDEAAVYLSSSAEFRALRDEVQAIQIQMAEKSKPWYRQTPLLISIASVLFTIFFSSYSIFYQRSTAEKEGLTKNLDRLQSAVSLLLEIRSEEAKDAGNAKNDMAGYIARNTIRNSKRIAILESAQAAQTALAAAKSPVPSAAYVGLGTEAFSDGQYAKGDEYFRLGIAAALPNTAERMWAYYARAQVRLMPDSPLYKPEEGRRFYKLAINERLPLNDNTRVQRGQLFGRVAQMEELNKTQEAGKYFQQAEAEAHAVNPLNPLRQTLLEAINIYKQAVTPAARGIQFADPKTWMGEWKLAFAPDNGRKGTITFIATQNFYGGYIDIFEDRKLIEKAMGQVTVLDEQRVRIDWTGQRIFPSPAQTAGYSIMKTSKGVLSMSGNQYSFGEAPAQVRIWR